jgi:hypothetical protein
MLHLPEQGAREDGEKRVDTSRQRLHVVVKQETPSLVRACGTVGVAGPQSHLSVSVSVRVPLPVTMSYSCVCHCERARIRSSVRETSGCDSSNTVGVIQLASGVHGGRRAAAW